MVIWALCVIVAGLIITWGAKTFPGPSYSNFENSLTMTFTGKFVLVFLSRIFSIHRTPEERERYLFNSLYHFHSLHRHLDISRVITVECLPLHVASSQTETGNLIYTYVILIYIYIAYIYIYILHIYIYIYIYMCILYIYT